MRFLMSLILFTLLLMFLYAVGGIIALATIAWLLWTALPIIVIGIALLAYYHLCKRLILK